MVCFIQFVMQRLGNHSDHQALLTGVDSCVRGRRHAKRTTHAVLSEQAVQLVWPPSRARAPLQDWMQQRWCRARTDSFHL
mmetsp:Transcript_14033/g.31092  ORF Transcript_14033/g.31092 Transcript_14033/m.31092 type:complete len:80 (+) Transcript_14033:487-726(+)